MAKFYAFHGCSVGVNNSHKKYSSGVSECVLFSPCNLMALIIFSVQGSIKYWSRWGSTSPRSHERRSYSHATTRNNAKVARVYSALTWVPQLASFLSRTMKAFSTYEAASKAFYSRHHRYCSTMFRPRRSFSIQACTETVHALKIQITIGVSPHPIPSVCWLHFCLRNPEYSLLGRRLLPIAMLFSSAFSISDRTRLLRNNS